MRAYGEMEKHGRYILDDLQFSTNHNSKQFRANTCRVLKKSARQASRRYLKKVLREVS